ncbi:DUF2169 domain-containing protein [Candidatus Methylospira mobilis]|uniref:DUF2169 domain-containing protein n=1 Tax=Candidatus Methylospira mobilis TaxID=1808979 RepID=UPI0028EBF90D|nr:DUF2169 domain-containing protein [Candidatus Methylospira mobilis]WNV06549.1 DUF2169 domain-containing protein [Candidatus Methylospira mobilis]
MKTIKELDHIVFRRPLGLNNGLWLSVAVGSFFHLDEPEKTGTSIELWKLVAETLGEGAILDGANPKPVGEFMVCGACWSASGAPTASSEVQAGVGKVCKRLTVYGDREWLPPGSESPLRISEPKPFVSMPVDWAAYGGEGYALNPAGLGVKPQPPFASWPLPNIENAATPRSSADQTPPAGFGMIDAKNPLRRRNMGTYDPGWLENRWPYYPDDFDRSYFNCAAADQRLEAGFFNPGDPIAIHNMHPAKSELQSRLPHLRHRAFIVQQQGGKEVFLEAPLSIDTVWLWPDRERGLVLARGMFPIADDEADDVKLLFTVTEPLSDPPLSVNEWYEKLQCRLARKVPFDLPPQIPDKDEALKNAAAKLESLPDELRKLKADSDSSSALPDVSAEKMEQEILQDEAKIAALLENPAYGTALQVNALRKAIKSRRAGAQGLTRQEEVEKLVAVPFDIELPLTQMRAQLQSLNTGNPQKYAELAAGLDRAEERVRGLKAKAAAAQQRVLDNPDKSPAELLIETAQDLLQRRDQLIEELKQLRESLKTDGFSILQREMASGEVQRIELRLKQVGPKLEALTRNAAQNQAQKDEVLNRLVEMSERVARRQPWFAEQTAELDLAALIKQIRQEKLAETRSLLDVQMPAGVKAPDLAAEIEKTLKAREEAGPDQAPDFSRMLDEMPPEAMAKIPPAELQKLKDLMAGANKRMAELNEKKPDGKLDLGKYHPSQKVMTRETIRQTVAEGGSLAGCDFTDLDLSGLDLAGGCFEDAHFVRTNLQSARFNGAKLNGANFDAVDAGKADFSEANLEKSRWLNKCVADKARFDQARASGMYVQGCSFKQSDFSGANLESAVFIKSELDQAGFHKAQMKKAVLSETSATACDFSASAWSNAVIKHSCIASSSFEDCRSPKMLIWNSDAKELKAGRAMLDRFTVGGAGSRLDGSCFDEATLTHTSQLNISAQRVSARRAILDRGYFLKVDMSGSDYYGARAPGARLTRCMLSEVNMGAINLMSGSLRKSGFAKTDLSASCLYAAEFYQARFVETRLDGAYTAGSGLTAKQRLAAARSHDEEKN